MREKIASIKVNNNIFLKNYITEEVANIRFNINDEEGKVFKNRTINIIDGIEGKALIFDGYSIWAEGSLKIQECEAFTLSMWVLPISFDNKTTIISNIDSSNNSGFEISCNKYGEIDFIIGSGSCLHKLESKVQCLKLGQWSHIATVFDSEMGWLYLYINGIEINRYQVPLYSKIKSSNNGLYIGKGKEDNIINSNICFNIFHGAIDTINIINESLSRDEVIESYEKSLEKFNGVIPFVKKEELLINREDYMEDLQRPRYHLIASGKWMNEPHAPIYFNGYYHIFYQANPHAPIWNNIKWGHMISKDMIRWKELPIVLDTADKDYDCDGCWSGSCCYDEKGIPTIFYTAGNNKLIPNQMIAMAKSNYLESGDLELRDWIRHKDILIKQSQDMGWYGEFRDPFVWKENNKWYMLVGTGTSQRNGGRAILFSSLDLLSWTYHGNIMDYDYNENKEVGQVWELPVLLPLRNLKGEVKKYILMFCACRVESDIVEVYYHIGNWDNVNNKFNSDHKEPKLFDLGHGTFTGGCGFVTPDNRSVIFTIAQGKRDFVSEFTSGWAHNGGIPIELSLDEKNNIAMKPIREVDTLRNKMVLDLENISLGEINKKLKSISGNMFEIKIKVKKCDIGIAIIYGEDKKISITYDEKFNRYSVYDNNKLISKYRGSIDDVILGDEIEMRCYLDYSMLECFINNTKSITLRNYTTLKERKIELVGNSEIIVSKVEIWEMNSAY